MPGTLLRVVSTVAPHNKAFAGMLVGDIAAQTGKDAFRSFLQHMDRTYAEQLSDIVIMANDDGTRAAAEFIVHGKYLADDEGLPPATGQAYVLPAGAFFDLEDGLISRVSVYYNLTDWIAQVSG